METSNRSAFLRRALLADATGSGACIAAILPFASPLSRLLQLPVELLFGAGIALVPFVAFVVAVARPQQPRPVLVWAVIASNFTWALASGALALSRDVAPNALGYAFIAVQALFVVAVAELELVGLRRAQGGLGGNSRRRNASVGAPT
jgi:hypothetical protein